VRHRQAPHWGRLARVLIGPPAARGRGLGADMVRQAATFGFGALGLEGIDLAVYTFNHQAIACYRRVGFAVAEPLPPTRFAGESWPGQRMHLPRAAWLRLTLAGGGTAP